MHPVFFVQSNDILKENIILGKINSNVDTFFEGILAKCVSVRGALGLCVDSRLGEPTGAP